VSLWLELAGVGKGEGGSTEGWVHGNALLKRRKRAYSCDGIGVRGKWMVGAGYAVCGGVCGWTGARVDECAVACAVLIGETERNCCFLGSVSVSWAWKVEVWRKLLISRPLIGSSLALTSN